MTSQELKNSILQYAIQGKLVPQNPNDEPASELIKRIKAEKEQLIKDKVIKREKTLLAVKPEEILFEIPESWEWVRLGDAFNIVMGQSPNGKSVTNSTKGVEFHQGKVFFSKKYILESNQTTNEPSKIAEANSVLLCVRAPVGIVNITNRKLCIGRGLCAIKPLAEMSVEFVFYMLETYKQIFVKQATGTTFVAITGEVVKNQLIPLPPLSEQQRIVAKIEELMPLVEQYGKAEAELKELNKAFPKKIKKSVLQYAIQGKLVPQNPQNEPASVLLEKIKAEKQKLIREKKIKAEKPLPVITEDEIPFEIPDNWVWVRIGELCLNVLGGFAYDSTKFLKLRTDNQVIRLGNVKPNKLVLETSPVYIDDFYASETEKAKLQNNDLLITMTGTRNKRDYLFTLCLTNEDLNNMNLFLNQRVGCFRFSELISSNYINYVLKDTRLIEPIYTSATGSANQANIGINTLKEMLIPLPPLSEQLLIIEKVEELFGYCDKLK
ncbi:MAG: restriction endonuclease subunit S [Paludibacter sp.]